MKKYTGFSIIELMLTIAIAGILMAVAVPSYTNMTKNNCLTTSVNSLVAALQRARSEAVKWRNNVTIAAAGGNWSSGWNVTMNEDRDGDSALDAGEDYDGDGALDASVTIQTATLTCGATITKTAGAATVSYSSDGFPILPSGTTEHVFRLCDDRTGETGRELTISITGRPNTNSNYICD